MATHIVINPDVLTFTTYEKAFLEVAGEPTSANVAFTVNVAGAAPRTVSVPMNARNFASSPDLFGLSGKKTALVIAVTSDATTPSAALLRQELGHSGKGAISVPSANRTLGTAFNLPVGSIQGGAELFIGNPSGTPANAVLQYGAATSPPAAQVTVPALGVTKLKITQAETNARLTITNGVQVIVQADLCARFLVVHPIGSAV
jgi:hypothetical protein